MKPYKCKACGEHKKDHTPYQWEVHTMMHECYKKAQKHLAKLVRASLNSR
jgi:tRNA(Ile2) C34 agmatinyltransferase TiaS